MKLNPDTTLVEAARRIAPVIQEHKSEAERERRLSRPVLDALYETGLVRMFTPQSLGGLEVDPITRALVIEEVAGQDTAAPRLSGTRWTGPTSAPDCRMKERRRSTAMARTS